MNSVQVFTGEKYTSACDVFSMAICIWEVLTGRMPYHDEKGNGPDMIKFKGNYTLWYAHATTCDPPLRPSPMSGVTELDCLIEQAWAKDHDRRPSSAEVHRRLVEIMQHYPGGDAPLTLTV